MIKYESIDDYFSSDDSFKDELNTLRSIVLKTNLVECFKWSSPVYTLEGKNLVGIIRTKKYFGLWFYQGALLKDESSVLVNAQEGKTKALRQMRFYAHPEINEHLILEYINEAISKHLAGLKITPSKKERIQAPAIFENALISDPVLIASFKALTKYKQREYLVYIIFAKRASTKQTRLEKIIPMIKNGIGLNDKYR